MAAIRQVNKRIEKPRAAEKSRGEVNGKKTAPLVNALKIDFPSENEKIIPGHYAVRIATPSVGDVELSINDGPWQRCRTACGYHWYDWWTTEAGSHKLLARVKAPKGRIIKSTVRTCTVVGSSSN